MSASAIQFLLARNRPEEAERVAREAISKDPEDIEALFYLGICLLEQSKPKQAEQALHDVIARDPEFDPAHFALARCLSERSRHKEALKAIATAIELDPDDATYHGLRASILAQQNKHADALEAAETGLALDPDNDTCRFYRSILLGKVGRHDEADSEASTLLADDPDDATSHCARGWVKQLAGDAEGAEQHFIEALRIDPGHEDARVGLAESLKMGNPLLGWFMRALLWMGRVPWYYLLGGIVVANIISRSLRNIDNPLPYFIGKGLQGLLISAFVLIMIHVPLFNLALASSRKGRLALSEDEKTGLRWALIPLIAGFAYLAHWWIGGLKALPFLAIACLSVASLTGEIMESPRTQVRRAMTAIAIVAAAVASYLIVFSHAVFPGMVADMLANLTTHSQDGAASPEDVATQLTERLMDVISLRRQYIDYPTFALFLAAGFRDEIREFFERRSSDTTR